MTNLVPTPGIPTRARAGRRSWLAALGACSLVVAVAAPAGAITGGQPDGGRHPYVGGTVLYFPPRDETIVNCTGSLISNTIFVTAAHCGRDGFRVSISLDEVFDADTSPRHPGTFIAHPDYDPAHESKNDVAVIQLDGPVPGVDASQLPKLPKPGMLDRMKDEASLRGSSFTSVGFGVRGYTTGPGGRMRVRGQARYTSVGSFSSLTPNQLHLSQNPSLGDGGTCDGDSGGPNFLGAGPDETLIIAGLTSTGDTYCQATNVTYRLDTDIARSFLGQFVALP